MTMIAPGALAPHFTLLGLDGREYSLPDGTAGEPLLIVFFRVSCNTCDLAFPYINRLQAAYPGGWRLWTISQDDPERTRTYRDRFGIAAPVLMDAPALTVSLLYDPPSTPALFLVGPDGRVDFVLEGFDKTDLNEISRRIAEYVGAATVEVAPADDGNPAMKPGCMARQLMPRRGT
ncbi:MAG TPA: TlpA disulfide reductase family protein [Dehalococcoidia bacterium]|jgi:peroxiredoxin|nr:TlpA disulfide reductase family protein [Dehalococcoidia bacterium]